MRMPDLDAIRRERASGRRGGSSYAQGVHPNPRFYKYVWWVFWVESATDGSEFLDDQHRLNTAAAVALLADLDARGEPYWLYNRRLPRRDPANPFDPNHLRWRDVEWAPAYDDDMDPVASEPLAGHR